MIISAGASSLSAFFVASILISMWLCGNFLKRYSVGMWLSFGGEGALNLFNGGRGELGDFERFWDKIWRKIKNSWQKICVCVKKVKNLHRQSYAMP